MIVRVHPLIAALKSKDCRRLDPRLAAIPVALSPIARHWADTHNLPYTEVKLASTPRLVKKTTPTSSTWNFSETIR